MNINTTINKQSGVASLFVVVFFTILISIIVISFVTIVSQDRQQALNNDLSSSAYDSAQVGVEDGKRGLELYYQKCVRIANPGGNPECSTTDLTTGIFRGPEGALIGDTCDQFKKKLGNRLDLNTNDASSEVKITTDDADEALNQAYTCLKVKLNTPDYKAALNNNERSIIPLKAINSGQPQSIKLNWYTKLSNDTPEVPDTASGGDFDLPTSGSNWGANKPPMMEVQVIGVPKSGSFSVDEIDDNSRTVFLYPSTNGSSTISLTSTDPTKYSRKNNPAAAKCDPDANQYTCSVLINDLAPNSSAYNYYVRIMPIYNSTDMQLLMYPNINGTGDSLIFDGINPEIDSTGRTNDVFRRVVTRVSFKDDKNGLDVSQGVCKAFQLADGDRYYSSDSACSFSSGGTTIDLVD